MLGQYCITSILFSHWQINKNYTNNQNKNEGRPTTKQIHKKTHEPNRLELVYSHDLQNSTGAGLLLLCLGRHIQFKHFKCWQFTIKKHLNVTLVKIATQTFDVRFMKIHKLIRSHSKSYAMKIFSFIWYFNHEILIEIEIGGALFLRWRVFLFVCTTWFQLLKSGTRILFASYVRIVIETVNKSLKQTEHLQNWSERVGERTSPIFPVFN